MFKQISHLKKSVTHIVPTCWLLFANNKYVFLDYYYYLLPFVGAHLKKKLFIYIFSLHTTYTAYL